MITPAKPKINNMIPATFILYHFTIMINITNNNMPIFFNRKFNFAKMPATTYYANDAEIFKNIYWMN